LDAGLGSYNEILKNNKKVGDVVDKYIFLEKNL